MSEALARAFDQWNKMLIDQQQWDVQRERSNQDFALKSMMLEEEARNNQMRREQMALSMQAQKQTIALQQQKVDDLKRFQTPMETSLYPIIGDDFAQTREGRDRMALLFAEHGEGVTVSPADGVLIDKNGKRIPIAPSEIASKIGMMDYINRSYRNMPDKIIAAQTQAQAQYDALQKKYNQLSTGPEASRFFPELAKIKKDMASAKGRVNRASKALESSSLSSFYGREAGDFESGAAFFRQYGDAAADQVKWLETQAEKFRTQEQAYLADSLKEKKSKPKIMYRVNNDLSSDEYGKTIDTVTVYPNTDVSKLVPEDGTVILDDQPRFLTAKDRGEGGDSKAKQPTPLSWDNVNDNIHNRYQIAINKLGGPDVTSGAVFDKRETHKKVAKGLALVIPPGTPDRFELAEFEAEKLVDNMEGVYQATMDAAEENKTDEKFMQYAVRLGQKYNKDGADSLVGTDKIIAKYALAAKEGKAQVGIEGFREWWNHQWKLMYRDQYKALTQGESELDYHLIYTPDKFTRDMKKLMEDIELN